MRTWLICGASALVFLTACGTGGGDGARPSSEVSMPSSGSDSQATAPSEEAAPPAETAAPAEPPEATSPVEEPAASVPVPAPGSDDDGTMWWPWALGAIVIVGGIASLAGRRRRRGDWHERTTTMLDGIDRLTIRIATATPEVLRAVASTDSAQLASIRAALAGQVAAAPDEAAKYAIDLLTMPAARLHAAVDAVAMTLNPDIGQEALAVAQLAAQLHTVASTARAGVLTKN